MVDVNAKGVLYWSSATLAHRDRHWACRSMGSLSPITRSGRPVYAAATKSAVRDI